MLEYFFQCPYCWQIVSMLVDTSTSAEEYVEDCEVCCNPIEINKQCENSELLSFEVKPTQ